VDNNVTVSNGKNLLLGTTNVGTTLSTLNNSINTVTSHVSTYG
jgi:hypothetical protein